MTHQDYKVIKNLLRIQQQNPSILRSYVDKVKWCINSEWATLSHVVTERAVDEWHQRLCACIHAEGGHFEHINDVMW